MTPADITRLVAQAVAQGHPAQVADPATIARIATIIRNVRPVAA